MSLLAYAHWGDPVNRHALLPGYKSRMEKRQRRLVT